MTLWPIALAAFGSTASMRICDPMLITLGREFQVSTGDASAVISAFAVAYGVLQFFYGPMGDRIGKLRAPGRFTGLEHFGAATGEQRT